MNSAEKSMLADLKRSGLTSADADILGFECSQVDGLDCYAIPYPTIDGKPTDHYRVRFLGAVGKLRKDKRGRSIRYTQPEGSAPRFYLPRIGDINWKSVAKDAAAPIYITEGEKKSAALCKLGAPCIGLGGVWNWRTSADGGHAIDDFNLFAWTGRSVRIAFDSDARYKTDVQKALRALADELIKRGAVPFSLDLPSIKGDEKTGLDDFLAYHGANDKALKRLLAIPERPLLIAAGASFADIVAKKIPAPRWVVPGLIPVGLTELVGAPKIGKSWMTLDLSIAVASGTKALGRFDSERGSVLHLALEDTERRFQDRLRRVLDTTPAPIGAYFFGDRDLPPSLANRLIALRRMLERHKDVRLVVIDTLGKMRAKPSGNGGSLYAEDYESIGLLKAIADEYGVGVLVVHHLRKASAEDPLDQVSGSTGITGAADTIMVLRRERGQADATLFVTGRDVAEQELALSLAPSTMRWAVLGDAEDYRMGQERKQILDALVFLGQPSSPSEVADHIGKARGAVKKMMLTMARQGQIWQLPQGGKYEPKPKGKTDGKF